MNSRYQQTWKSLHPVINEFKLKPYHYPKDFINTKSSTIQEVEDILDSGRQGNGLQYLAKWQGQPFEESTWEDRQEVIKGGLCQGGVMSRITQKVTASHPNAPEFDLDA